MISWTPLTIGSSFIPVHCSPTIGGAHAFQRASGARRCAGAEFDATAKRHFSRLRSDPPDYIVTGFTESPELEELIRERYSIVARGPDFMANARRQPPRLLARDDR